MDPPVAFAAVVGGTVLVSLAFLVVGFIIGRRRALARRTRRRSGFSSIFVSRRASIKFENLPPPTPASVHSFSTPYMSPFVRDSWSTQYTVLAAEPKPTAPMGSRSAPASIIGSRAPSPSPISSLGASLPRHAAYTVIDESSDAPSRPRPTARASLPLPATPDRISMLDLVKHVAGAGALASLNRRRKQDNRSTKSLAASFATSTLSRIALPPGLTLVPIVAESSSGSGPRGYLPPSPASCAAGTLPTRGELEFAWDRVFARLERACAVHLARSAVELPGLSDEQRRRRQARAMYAACNELVARASRTLTSLVLGTGASAGGGGGAWAALVAATADLSLDPLTEERPPSPRSPAAEAQWEAEIDAGVLAHPVLRRVAHLLAGTGESAVVSPGLAAWAALVLIHVKYLFPTAALVTAVPDADYCAGDSGPIARVTDPRSMWLTVDNLVVVYDGDDSVPPTPSVVTASGEARNPKYLGTVFPGIVETESGRVLARVRVAVDTY
ncbi:hypothetical protein H9P43_009857 [Blastocladiella emersonii ATCC 22665]|nr:hypothetical protein H9P43_009857 [Blastocladiella emersonii ATCC 22665]